MVRSKAKIKFLECAPTNPNNKIACSGYMSGAILAGFQIIGTTHKNSFNVYAFQIEADERRNSLMGTLINQQGRKSYIFFRKKTCET